MLWARTTVTHSKTQTVDRQLHWSRQEGAVFTGCLWEGLSEGFGSFLSSYLVLYVCPFLFVFSVDELTHTGTQFSLSGVPRRVSLLSPFSVIHLSSFLMFYTQIQTVPSLNRPKRNNLHATAQCSSLWPRTSSPSPSCSGTRWWSAAPTGWSRRRSSSSCPWWWICWLRTLSPVLSAGPWCTVFSSFCPGGKASRRAGAPPHLRTKRRGQSEDVAAQAGTHYYTSSFSSKEVHGYKCAVLLLVTVE